VIWPILPPWFPPQSPNDWFSIAFVALVLAWVVVTLFRGDR
jgi:hypothetical protein